MLFNSFEFLFFFIVVTFSFFAISHKYRWLLLLAASCVFYMAFIPKYILILGFTIVIDYFAGILIENQNKKDKKKSRVFLIISLMANLGVLALFKYFNFFSENLQWLLQHMGIVTYLPLIKIILPIGLSFHTFQAMSYTIEVFRGSQKAEKHFGIYALYVMFYPQLVAGPIERPQNVLHQFHEEQFFKYDRVISGLRLMVWGLFKKVVIADRLAIITDPVFDHPGIYSAIALFMAAFFFSFQIFCDFSGYSDIALGSARVMGFRLMKNFDRPYQSRSIAQFWSKWHISLSSWFRDYLYIPLGGNRVSIPRWYFNLLFVFVISGLWHGANWTFIIWGVLHGLYLVIGLATQKLRYTAFVKTNLNRYPKIVSALQVTGTFFLVTVAWIFFRSNSLTNSFAFLNGMMHVFTEVKTAILTGAYRIGLQSVTAAEIVLSILLIVFLETVQYINARYNLGEIFNKQAFITRWAIYYAGILVIVFLGVFEKRSFIYFQF